MGKILRLTTILLSASLITLSSSGQYDRFAYAITDLNPTGSGWNVLRKLNLKTGEYSDVLLNGIQKLTVYDAATKKAFTYPADTRYAQFMQLPFNSGVAAMAYDKRHSRIYYTPMFIDQLRYIDLKTMKIYYITDQAFTSLGNMHNQEGKIITRMVIAPDGYGYAISNDASTFVRFTTGRKTEITHLGGLVDDPSNGNISIQNRCSSWGGDALADDDGHLYIVSARNSVFKVDIENATAKLIGHISGLPADFTSNGAAVTNEGTILVSSAVHAGSWFEVDPSSWTAKAFAAPGTVYKSSDLANSNYLQTKPKYVNDEIVTRRAPENPMNDKLMIYPNPVSNNQFTLQFGKVTTGNYNLELTDVMGRLIMQRIISVQAEDQVETISLQPSMARGIYLIKVIDQQKKETLSQKLVVQ